MPTEKWDRRFLDLATLVSSWSKDPSTKVGAVVVDDLKRVRGIGFNGFARGVSDSQELLDNRNDKLNRMIHAEINAVLNACTTINGCTLYITIPPCNMCVNFLIQSGVRRIVWMKPSDALTERWGASWELSKALLAEAGIKSMECPSHD